MLNVNIYHCKIIQAIFCVNVIVHYVEKVLFYFDSKTQCFKYHHSKLLTVYPSTYLNKTSVYDYIIKREPNSNYDMKLIIDYILNVQLENIPRIMKAILLMTLKNSRGKSDQVEDFGLRLSSMFSHFFVTVVDAKACLFNFLCFEACK